MCNVFYKYRAFCYIIILCLVLLTPIQVNASGSLGDTGGGDSSHDSSEGGDGGGGDEGDSGEGEGSGSSEGEGSYTPRIPTEITISPMVTAIHSLNAWLANPVNTGQEGLGVYFIPSLEDFPVNPKDTVANLTDANNVQHKFAAVYDGYFDTEVEYVQAIPDPGDYPGVARLQTSKKVYSSVDNTRALNLIGYDLLLANEQVSITANGDTLYAQYLPTLVGTTPLNAQTVIMDLYKAIGEYEWDIKYAFVTDPELLLETSPIQNEFGVTINDEVETGINTEEGATYIWATRTNPELYWNRCKRDSLFDGGAHSVTSTKTSSFIGSMVSVSFGKSQGDTVTFGEFCAMARAVMDLYGEPVMTTKEQQIMIQNYGWSLPSCQDKELYDSVTYLAAKGIIDPTEVAYNKYVTFADIEPILVRIRNKDSRLTFKEAEYNQQSELYQKGFVSATTAILPGELTNVDIINSDVTTEYNDFFVQCSDDATNFLLTPPDTLADTSDDILAADNLMCNGIASSSVEGFDYTFQNMGVEGDFYHFKINAEETEVVITYERDINRMDYMLNRESYELPNANGGVYLVNGDSFTWYSFDEAAGQTYVVDGEVKELPEYSTAYIDNERRENSEFEEFTDFGYMSKWNWIYCAFDDTAHDTLENYSLWGVPLTDLKTLTSGTTMIIEDGSHMSPTNNIMVKYIHTTKGNRSIHNYIFQTPYELSSFKSHFTDTSYVQSQVGTAFYSPNDEEVLVSYQYLTSKGLVSNYKLSDNNNRCILTLAKSKTNVVLDKDNNIIIVGNTLYRANSNEMLFTVSEGILYINYRACIGWTADVLVLNSNGNIILSSNIPSASVSVTYSTSVLNSFFPTSSAGIGMVKVGNDSFVNMSGTNMLSNYMLVMDTSGGSTDYLFMWKRKEYVMPGSSNVQSYSGTDAIQLFKDKTGIDLNENDDYVLMYTALTRNTNTTSNVGNFRYTVRNFKNSNGIESNMDYGWMYRPNSYGNYTDAISSYLGTANASMLPLAYVNNSLCNLNINFCTVDALSDPLPAGTMPTDYTKSSSGRLMQLQRSLFQQLQSTLSQASGNAAGAVSQGSNNAANSTLSNPLQSTATLSRIKGARSYEDTGADYENTDFKILPAPVGMFNSLLGLPSRTVRDAQGRDVWYGSQLCTAKDGKLVLKSSRHLVDDNPDKIVSAIYVGSGNSAVYSYGVDSVAVNVVDTNSLPSVNAIQTDPDYLVDWEAFTFGRLVQNLDDLSTIWLIFALNILPRIAMAFFFILMILSLIADFPVTKKFCHKVFDVYSALTLGHITVDTINLKRLFIQSLIALAIFGMVQDGILFEFMLWCGEIFIELMQR